VLIERLTGAVRKREWKAAYDDILDFEQQLAADGTIILKFWLHISKKEQRQRFDKLLDDKLTAWQVSDEDAAQHDDYKRYRRAVEEMLARTEAAHAPWTIVEATDRRFTQLKVLETIIHSLETRLGADAPPPVDRGLEAPPPDEAGVPAAAEAGQAASGAEAAENGQAASGAEAPQPAQAAAAPPAAGDGAAQAEAEDA
jgi:hypothetical protein